MEYAQATPSLSQAQRVKKLSQSGECTLDAMCDIMDEVKKGDLDRITIRNDVLKKYFPKSYTPKQMEDTIIRLLEQWQKKETEKSGTVERQGHPENGAFIYAEKGERMSDKNFTMYVTGGTNVFIPVLSDDPKQVSRVLDSLKRCYGDDDSEEVKAALSFVSDYLDDLTAEDDKKDSDGKRRKRNHEWSCDGGCSGKRAAADGGGRIL